uniref:hypothetical protein n=1 Tax=Sandarakinorhabdus rubra TaxID=2672568 RepID=UPI001969C695
QLVAYAARPEAKAPALRYALARDGVDAAPEAPPQALAAPSGPRLVAASYVAQPAAGAPTPLLPEPATDAPEDRVSEPQDREG